MITILGPTACGKTTLAARLAAQLDAEIIGADSRQVYRNMDLGTGKDLADYHVDGRHIPYHLIDIAEAGEKYNVYRFQKDFVNAYEDIRQRRHTVILCGGTGLYIESVLRKYRMEDVPQNTALRQNLEGRSLDELTSLLASYGPMHNKTDVDTAQRAIRAIEIADYYAHHLQIENPEEERTQRILEEVRQQTLVVGIHIDRDLRRERISRRLRERLDEGMVDEVRKLLSQGLKPEDLIYYGLEYKYLTLYATGKMSYDDMVRELEIAIHQFAKRQMTWFRGMERRGIHIHWIEATDDISKKISQIEKLCTTGSYL